MNNNRLLDLKNNLKNHANGPCRSDFGIQVDQIIARVDFHEVKGEKPYYVYEWKHGNPVGAIFAMGISAGRITSFRVLNEDKEILGSYGDMNFNGGCYMTSSTNANFIKKP